MGLADICKDFITPEKKERDSLNILEYCEKAIQATPTPTPIPGQTPQPQITEAPEQPQLPPAQNEVDSQPEVTELPTNQQISNVIEEKVDETN